VQLTFAMNKINKIFKNLISSGGGGHFSSIPQAQKTLLSALLDEHNSQEPFSSMQIPLDCS
jgi:hypothetical protein